jgi:hypothetical protein
MEYIEVKINSAWGYTGHVTMTMHKYKELHRKYGTWYPVAHDVVKCFNSKKQEWTTERI